MTHGRTAYDRYLRVRELHELQAPVTTTEGEMSFLVVCQVQELWFGLIGTDLRTARGHLDGDDVGAAAAALERIAAHFSGLNASWDSLMWMKPQDFRPIKEAMTAAHGRSTSLQSWKYREMVFLLGLKDVALTEPVESGVEHAELLATLEQPSVYDAAVDLLHRRGLALAPAGLDDARPSDGHRQPRAEIEQGWGRVYDGTSEHADLQRLADALFAVAERFSDYKHRHLLSTRRSLGSRPAYYGVSGVDWLLGTISDLPFPELWSLRLADES